MKWSAGSVLLLLALMWLASSEPRGWGWATDWGAKVIAPQKPAPTPVPETPPPDLAPIVPPPVVEPPPVPPPVAVPTPKPAPKPAPKKPKVSTPKPANASPKPVNVSAADCAQIRFGISMIGRDGVRAEARKRGYSSSQIAAAERACGL